MRFHDTSRIRTCLDQRVSAADGTELSVDLYFPPDSGRYPVLLHRTPADNNRAGRAGISLPPAERWKVLAAQGYIVAAADVRGRGDSDGEFVPFTHEGSDGAATIAWLRTLQECSGKVGVFGSGYGAFCAWAAAVADGHVDAIASISPFGAVGEGLVHRGGAVRLDWLFWMHLIAGRTVQPPHVPPWPAIHRHTPLQTMDESLGREDIWWRDWLAHLERDNPFWGPLDLADKIAALKIPGLHVTGWWDGEAAGAHYYYEAACRGGAPQRLIIGPWDTAAVRRPVAKVGGFDFGPRSLLDLDETMAEFFDGCFRSAKTTEIERTVSSLFVTGRNEWVTHEKGTVPSHDTLTLYLSSTIAANTRRGDGVLLAQSEEAGVDTLTHNPMVPVDFQPQFISFAAGANPLGFTLDQGHITARDEALVYTSAPLDAAIRVVGRPRLTLSVRTTAADADIFVLLSDSFPLGSRDLNLGHGAVRLGALASFKAGELIRIELQLDPLAHDFFQGHQIRLTVTSSLFPLYARNLHVADYVNGHESNITEIEIHHGPGAVALLTLPVAGLAQ